MFDYIVFIISYGEGLNEELVKQETRKAEVVFARQLIMYFAVLFKTGSYKQIAGDLGGQNHATVNHALISINNYICTDKQKRAKIEYYKLLLKKVLKLSIQSEDIKKTLAPIEKQISELEQRCINITLQLAFLKNKTLLKTKL